MSATAGTVAPERPGTPLPVLEQPQVPSWRLMLTLGGAGALAGLLIVLAYSWTLPSIERHRATVLRGAIEEVLKQPEHADTLYLYNDALVAALPAGVNGAKLERVYRGYVGGRPVGYALTASEPGFADQIALIFGYDPDTRTLLGMKILSSKETPGLGDKIERPAFMGQFAQRVAPLVGVKTSAPAADRSAVVMITGATISSRTVIREMNAAVERWQPLLAAYQSGAARRGGQ
jgi:electron transport complex protein RnfG